MTIVMILMSLMSEERINRSIGIHLEESYVLVTFASIVQDFQNRLDEGPDYYSMERIDRMLIQSEAFEVCVVVKVGGAEDQHINPPSSSLLSRAQGRAGRRPQRYDGWAQMGWLSRRGEV